MELGSSLRRRLVARKMVLGFSGNRRDSPLKPMNIN
jgi:hypothetical protein